MQRDRHLLNPHFSERRLDDHLGSKLHPGRLQIHFLKRGLAQPPQPTMEIMTRTTEKQPPNCRQHGIPQPPMFPRHRPGQNRSPASRHPAPHHQIRPRTQLLQKRPDLREIVTQIRIPHDHKSPPRGFQPCPQRTPVSPHRHIHHPGTTRPRNLLRTIRAPIVRDQNLRPISNSRCIQPSPRRFDATRKRLGLIQTRH